MTISKCPKCEKSITYIRVENVDLNAGSQSWHGVSYYCPHCHVVLGVELDPVALKADIVNEILRALGHKG